MESGEKVNEKGETSIKSSREPDFTAFNTRFLPPAKVRFFFIFRIQK
ncbi:hypothetical protein [Acidaminococcus fermentans]|nr:hypothetical protein [Acidaminococcus fermentans]